MLQKDFMLVSGCLKKGMFRKNCSGNTFMAFTGHMTYNKNCNIRYETAEKFNFVSQPTSSMHRRKCLFYRNGNAVILQLCFVDILEIALKFCTTNPGCCVQLERFTFTLEAIPSKVRNNKHVCVFPASVLFLPFMACLCDLVKT